MTARPELVLRLTRSLAVRAPADPLPTRLCGAFIDVVAARGGSIALGLIDSGRTVVCATSADAARWEDAQDLAAQGPSLDAFRTGRLVRSSSVADLRHRWSAFAEVASALPAGSVHAIPMRPGRTVVGVLAVHHHEHAELGYSEDELQFLSDAVGAAILGELPDGGDGSRLWSERDRISQAVGMVVAQLDLDPGDALAVLRAHAFAHETTVHEVARRVVERELDFTGPLPW